MKKQIPLLIACLGLALTSCQQSEKDIILAKQQAYDIEHHTILKITEQTRFDTVTTTTVDNPNVCSNSVIGGTLGYLVTGGLGGVLVGAATGAAVSDKQTHSTTQTEIVPIHVYTYTLSDSTTRTASHAHRTWYNIGDVYNEN